jgi:large repetitive protein
MYLKKHIIVLILMSVSFFSLYAQPGKDGSYTVTTANQVLNKYAILSSNISVGDNTLSLVAGPSFSLCSGDLVMVYQAQGATTNTTGTVGHGDIIDYGSAGNYELKYITSSSGNILTLNSSFTNSFSVSGRTQIIKIPQFSNLTVNAGASIVAKVWKDTTITAINRRFGGLVVIHALNIINNGTISATNAGFRGGQLTANTALNYGTSIFASSATGDGGEKGESINGNSTEYNTGGGRFGRGAVANGGGGGNGINAPGGGGANGFNGNSWTGHGVMLVNVNNPISAWSLDPGFISNGNSLSNSSGGGRGGYSWADLNGNGLLQGPGNVAWGGDNRREVGGRGGRPLTNINANSRIYFGGGGGAGHQNNSASTPGTSGGGIVYVMCSNNISGTGLIESNANNVPNTVGCSCDGSGGGGAGGSIVVKAVSIATTQSLSAIGGNGGNQLPLSGPAAANESEGPGGGGGGGFVAISTTGIIPNVSGGLNGTTLSTGVTEMTSNGATQGATGETVTISSSFITYTPATTTPSTMCQGQTLSLISPSVGLSYQWTGPNSFTSSVQNPSITNVLPVMSGGYTVMVEQTSGCYNTFVTNLNVVQQPSVSGTKTLCNGQTVNLKDQVEFITVLGQTPTNTSGIVSPISSTIYTVQLTNTRGTLSCNATQTVYVLVNPGPEADFNFDINTCGGGVQFFDLSSDDITSRHWIINSETTFSIQNPYHFYNQGGIYTVTLTVNNSYGCSNTISNTFSISTPPPVSISPSLTICKGKSAQLSASGGSSYQWRPTFYLNNPNFSSPISKPETSINYSVLINVPINDKLCEMILTTAVNVDELSVKSSYLSTNSSIVNIGESAELKYNGDEGALVLWQPQTIPQIGYEVKAFPTKPTTYTAIVTKGVCKDTLFLKIDAYSKGCLQSDVFVPNTFTPNGDGKNDVLFVRGIKLDKINFSVYNRWGEQVFATKDINVGWDGSYKSKLLDAGVFGWQLYGQCLNGEEVFLKGNVNLIR